MSARSCRRRRSSPLPLIRALDCLQRLMALVVWARQFSEWHRTRKIQHPRSRPESVKRVIESFKNFQMSYVCFVNALGQEIVWLLTTVLSEVMWNVMI